MFDYLDICMAVLSHISSRPVIPQCCLGLNIPEMGVYETDFVRVILYFMKQHTHILDAVAH